MHPTSQHQKNILTVLKEQTFGAPPEKPKRKKRKGPKGPNPLSVKKASKKKFSSSSATAETTEEEAKKKRRKKKKIAAHVLEEIQSWGFLLSRLSFSKKNAFSFCCFSLMRKLKYFLRIFEKALQFNIEWEHMFKEIQ